MPKPKQNTRKTNRRKPARNSAHAPLWAWVVIGCLVAALVALLIFLANRSDLPAKVSQPVAPKPEEEEKVAQPRFDFYEILKEREIEVPDRSAEVTAALETDIDLYLQVASFQNAMDADQLRANLLLQNMDAFIEQIEKDGRRWHRVIVGPFASRSMMAKARSDLAAQEFNTLLLRRQSQQ